MFYTVAELQRQRKKAARQARRTQRSADTAIEKIERRLLTLIDRKTLITKEAAMTLVPLWNEFIKNVNDLEHDLADFISVTQI